MNENIPPSDQSVHTKANGKTTAMLEEVFGNRYSEGPTIRGIRTAFAETPAKLRELEDGWRARRRALVVRRENTDMGVDDGQGVCGAVGKLGGWYETEVCPVPKTIPRRDPDERALRGAAVAVDLMVRREETRRKPRNRPISVGMPNTSSLGDENRASSRPFKLTTTPPSKLLPRPFTNNPAMRDERASKHRESSEPEPAAILPILASPLPPTPQPVPLTGRSSDTIHVHAPTSDLGLTLTQGSAKVQISADGRTIEFRQDDKKKNRHMTRSIGLDAVSDWTEQDKKDWYLVAKLVEGYKRHTPRVSVQIRRPPSSH